jgi:hypothetical protein
MAFSLVIENVTSILGGKTPESHKKCCRFINKEKIKLLLMIMIVGDYDYGQ